MTGNSYYARNQYRIREQQCKYYARNKGRITAHRRARYASLRWGPWYQKLIFRHYMNQIRGRIAAGPARLADVRSQFEAALRAVVTCGGPNERRAP